MSLSDVGLIHYYNNLNQDGCFGLTEAGIQNASDQRSR